MGKLALTLSLFAALSLLGGQAYACDIQGSVVYKDGSKAGSESWVATDWNSKKAYPSSGKYRLDLGDHACGKTVRVSFRGDVVATVTLKSSGWTTANLRGR